MPIVRAVAGTFLLLGAMACGRSSGADTTKERPPAKAEASAPAADTISSAESSKKATYTCHVKQNKLCYTTSPPQALLPGEKSGCSGEWKDGEHCPAEGVVATCEKKRNDEKRRFYQGVDLKNAETSCTAFGGTFSPST
jgi:hypothetical protein